MTATNNGHVKAAARGRWRDILAAHGFNSDELDGRHHPCPKCGGTDRFRAFDDVDETGGVFCNQCFSERNGDGLAAKLKAVRETVQQSLKSLRLDSLGGDE